MNKKLILVFLNLIASVLCKESPKKGITDNFDDGDEDTVVVEGDFHEEFPGSRQTYNHTTKNFDKNLRYKKLIDDVKLMY